ncbi:MAG: hypothetical protein Q9218_004490 [Villophora microphyllina]
MPETFDDILREVDAKIEARCEQIAKDNGFATYAEYDEARERKREERMRAAAERRRERKERGEPSPKRRCVVQATPSPPVEPWYKPERCNLRSEEGSMDGWGGEMREAQRPKIENLVIDEFTFSRRYPDYMVHRLWSLDSRDPRHQQELPRWVRHDAVLQYLLSLREASTPPDDLTPPPPLPRIISQQSSDLGSERGEKRKRSGEEATQDQGNKRVRIDYSPPPVTQANLGADHHDQAQNTDKQLGPDKNIRQGSLGPRSKENKKRKQNDKEPWMDLSLPYVTQVSAAVRYEDQSTQGTDIQPNLDKDVHQESIEIRSRETTERNCSDEESSQDSCNERAKTHLSPPPEILGAPAVKTAACGKKPKAVQRLVGVEEKVNQSMEDQERARKQTVIDHAHHLRQKSIARQRNDTWQDRGGRIGHVSHPAQDSQDTAMQLDPDGSVFQGSSNPPSAEPRQRIHDDDDAVQYHSKKRPRKDLSPPGETLHAPKMEQTTSQRRPRRKFNDAVSVWHRAALKESRKTRSSKETNLYAFNQQSNKLEMVVARILTKFARQTRSQKQEEHFELVDKEQPVAVPSGRTQAANVEDKAESKALPSQRKKRSKTQNKAKNKMLQIPQGAHSARVKKDTSKRPKQNRGRGKPPSHRNDSGREIPDDTLIGGHTEPPSNWNTGGGEVPDSTFAGVHIGPSDRNAGGSGVPASTFDGVYIGPPVDHNDGVSGVPDSITVGVHRTARSRRRISPY